MRGLAAATARTIATMSSQRARTCTSRSRPIFGSALASIPARACQRHAFPRFNARTHRVNGNEEWQHEDAERAYDARKVCVGDYAREDLRVARFARVVDRGA